MDKVFSWLKNRWLLSWRSQAFDWSWRRGRVGRYVAEWLAIVIVAYLYAGAGLLDFDPRQLQQSGEHNESVTLPLLADIGLNRYGEIPLWNPYMLTGFPLSGDFINHFWNPASTLPIWIWGGVNGMKVSTFLSFVLAGIGQWWFAHIFGLRGFVRLWAGIMYMISGGLAMLWRVGWYELLLGIAWFPWCFAALWWALRRRDRASLALTAIFTAIVLTSGGGYYPIYLFVSMGVLLGTALLWSRPAGRWPKLRRALVIAGLSGGLAAVTLLPLTDGYRYTAREAGQDREQRFSQPIPYALINYVVSQPDWFRAEILGTAGGSNWFYIGWLPLAALALVPLAFSQARWRRTTLASLAILTLVLLAWHANKYTPVNYVYEWIPFLYNLRFLNRLLVLVTSPLLVLGSLGLQHLFLAAGRWGRGRAIAIARREEKRAAGGIPLRIILSGAILLVMLLGVRDVYSVNKGFAFAPRPIPVKPFAALTWLKNYDPDLYYINIGGGAIYWDWTPAAYLLEVPIINFDYGRRMVSQDAQRRPETGSPFYATPKYMLALPDQPRPTDAEMLRDFDGVGLWYLPDALPFAFSAPPASLQPFASFSRQDVSALQTRLDGPNRVVVTGEAGAPGECLVVLVSDYPGWRLFVDGQPAEIRPANRYLGAAMLPGEHTYIFVFQPAKHYVGLGISLLTLVIALGLLLADSRWRQAHDKATWNQGSAQ